RRPTPVRRVFAPQESAPYQGQSREGCWGPTYLYSPGSRTPRLYPFTDKAAPLTEQAGWLWERKSQAIFPPCVLFQTQVINFVLSRQLYSRLRRAGGHGGTPPVSAWRATVSTGWATCQSSLTAP